MRNRWLQHDSVPFDVYELTESVPHFNQVRSIFHDNIDRLLEVLQCLSCNLVGKMNLWRVR